MGDQLCRSNHEELDSFCFSLDSVLSNINDQHLTACSIVIGDFNSKWLKWCTTDKDNTVGLELGRILNRVKPYLQEAIRFCSYFWLQHIMLRIVKTSNCHFWTRFFEIFLSFCFSVLWSSYWKYKDLYTTIKKALKNSGHSKFYQWLLFNMHHFKRNYPRDFLS